MTAQVRNTSLDLIASTTAKYSETWHDTWSDFPVTTESNADHECKWSWCCSCFCISLSSRFFCSRPEREWSLASSSCLGSSLSLSFLFLFWYVVNPEPGYLLLVKWLMTDAPGASVVVQAANPCAVGSVIFVVHLHTHVQFMYACICIQTRIQALCT